MSFYKFWFTEYMKMRVAWHYALADETTFMQWRTHQIAGVANICGV